MKRAMLIAAWVLVAQSMVLDATVLAQVSVEEAEARLLAKQQAGATFPTLNTCIRGSTRLSTCPGQGAALALPLFGGPR